jgi:hypothetical protein
LHGSCFICVSGAPQAPQAKLWLLAPANTNAERVPQ